MGSAFFEQVGQTGSKECSILPASRADRERQPLLPSKPLLRCERCPCTRSFTSRASPQPSFSGPRRTGRTPVLWTDQALWTQRESASPPLEREQQEGQKQNSKTQTGPCRSGELGCRGKEKDPGLTHDSVCMGPCPSHVPGTQPRWRSCPGPAGPWGGSSQGTCKGAWCPEENGRSRHLTQSNACGA